MYASVDDYLADKDPAGVEGFLRFRAPFHHELALAARRRGFDATETADVLQATERAMDQLLVATMTGHGGNGHGRRGKPGNVTTSRVTRASRDR